MILELYKVFCIVAAFQLILFSIFLLTYKKGKPLSNRLLAIFLLAKAIAIINIIFLFFWQTIYRSCPHLFFIGGSFSFIYGPSLYFYTKSLVYHDFKFKKWHVVHLFPFMLHVIYFSYKYHFHSADFKRELLRAGFFTSISERVILDSSLHLLILGYLLASLITLIAYRSHIKNIYSTVLHINLSWLYFVLIGFITLYVFGITNFVIRVMTLSYNSLLSLLQTAGFFIFANIIVYKGLKQPEIFSEIEEKPKYATSSLTKSDKEKYLKKITSYMKLKKPYLSPSLNINVLAEELSIPPRHLSQVINESLNQNFFDFVNRYRIEEAKHYFSNHTDNRKTVLEILYDVGFNSKSSFNNVFKRYTGMTPTEFKKLYHPN